MYDLIASWMTSGGPLQELARDDRTRIHHTAEAVNDHPIERAPARAFASRLAALPFARRMRGARPLRADACLADQCVPC
jgi:hypothetical protein